MPRARVRGINDIANALFGTTSNLASRTGFRQQASGNASIASALFNRSKTFSEDEFRNQRIEGLDLQRLINTPEGKQNLIDFLITGEKLTGQGTAAIRTGSQDRGFRDEAADLFRGTPDVPADPTLGAQLAGVSGRTVPDTFSLSKEGRLDKFSGEIQDTPGSLAERNLRVQKTETSVAQAEKFNAVTDKLNLQIQQIESGGRVPPTGSAVLSYAARIRTSMGALGNLEVRKPIEEFATPEFPEGRSWNQISDREKTMHILGQIKDLTEEPEIAGQVLKDLDLQPDAITKAKEEIGVLYGSWQAFTGWMESLFGTEDEPKIIPPDPDAQTGDINAPEQPAPVQPDLVPQSRSLPGVNPFPFIKETEGSFEAGGPTARPTPLLADSLGPGPRPPATAGGPGLPALPARVPTTVATPFSGIGDFLASRSGPPELPTGSARTPFSDLAEGLSQAQIEPAVLEAIKRGNSKSLRDRIFDLGGLKQAGNPENARIDAMIKALEDELRRRGDL